MKCAVWHIDNGMQISHDTEGLFYRLDSRLNIWYRQTDNINGTLVENKLVDHSDVVGAGPVGAAPTTSSFST